MGLKDNSIGEFNRFLYLHKIAKCLRYNQLIADILYDTIH